MGAHGYSINVRMTTVTTLVVTALVGDKGKLYDPAVSDGKILVGVENPTRAVDQLEGALTLPGAEIKRT